VLIVFAPSLLFSQNTKENGEFNDFIPAGWRIFKKAVGDLNKDGIEDVAFVIKGTDKGKVKLVRGEEAEYDTIDSNPRTLLVLIKDAVTNKFSLIGKSKSFIVSYAASAGDSFRSITIAKGLLKLEFFFWYANWREVEASYTFRFQNEGMDLIGAAVQNLIGGALRALKGALTFPRKK
jgi:hypothetical protein